MKNIFLLATNESSRLGLHSNNQLVLHINALTKNLPHFKPQHIYNTSDEEIKKGDWFLDLTDNTLWRNQGPESMSRILFPECKKIILTTDATLIADGVQEIDDTFLEWFIKNPTCDYVEVKVEKFGVWRLGYKIIIPQEEPKQREVFLMNANEIIDTRKPKPETLEEAAERILANNIDGLRDALQDDDLFFFYKGVIQCYGEAMVEWKAEALYNEEQVYKILQELRLVFKSGVQKWQEDFEFDLDKWFEQFSKLKNG